MGGFNIVSYWGVDAAGVGTGTDAAVRKVEDGAGAIDRAGSRAGRSFDKGTRTIYVNKKKVSTAIIGLTRDLGSGMSVADSFGNAMAVLGKGVRGALGGLVLAGGVTYFAKKFGEAKDHAKALQETLDALDAGNLNAGNASVKELVSQLGKYKKAAKDAKDAGGKWNDFIEVVSGTTGANRIAQARGEIGAGNMLNEVMKGQEGAAKAAHLQATGRKKEAARVAFGVKRGGERADLENSLKDGKVGENEMSTILSDFDAETNDQMRAMGLRRVGKKGNNQAPTPFSGLSELAKKNGRTITTNQPEPAGPPPPPGLVGSLTPSGIMGQVKSDWNSLKKYGGAFGHIFGQILNPSSGIVSPKEHLARGAAMAHRVGISDPVLTELRGLRQDLKNAPIIKMK